MFCVAEIRKGRPITSPVKVAGRDDLLAWARTTADRAVRAQPVLFGLVGPGNVLDDGTVNPEKAEQAITMEAIDVVNGLWPHALSGTLPAYHRSKAAGELMIWEEPS